MAASVVLKVKSATFKGKTIVGVENFTMEVSGSEQTTRGDGATTLQSAYNEGIRAIVTLQAIQGESTTGDKDLIVPGNGALVVVCFRQADGAGQTGGGDKTYTFPNANLSNTSAGKPLNGNPSTNYNFTVVDAAGNLSTLFSVA